MNTPEAAICGCSESGSVFGGELEDATNIGPSMEESPLDRKGPSFPTGRRLFRYVL